MPDSSRYVWQSKKGHSYSRSSSSSITTPTSLCPLTIRQITSGASSVMISKRSIEDPQSTVGAIDDVIVCVSDAIGASMFNIIPCYLELNGA